MILSDFEWCGQSGSLFGLLPCNFDTPAQETNENGANLEFATVRAPGSDRHRPLSGRYTEALTGTFRVCKNPRITPSPFFDTEDIRFFNRWLNRRDGYHKFKIWLKGESGYPDYYFRAFLNLKKLELGGRVAGLEITVTTDSPYACFEPRTAVMNLTPDAPRYTYTDISDEVGHLYPTFTILCSASGDLSLQNSLSGIRSCIRGCSPGEVLTMDSEHKILSSSLRGDAVMKSFNFGWLDIMNTYENRRNTYSANLPCTVTMTYSPIAKVGL